MAKSLKFFLFFIPLFTILTAVVGYPLLSTIYLSFFEKKIGAGVTKFIFLSNYIQLIKDDTFWFVLLNTFTWTILNVALTTFVGILLAVLLSDERMKGVKFFRVLLIIPWAISIPGAMAWIWLMNGDYGFLNEILVSLGIIKQYVAWLAEPDIVLFSCTIANVWFSYPYMTVMLLAGLQSIPRELYDASAIDGVNKFQEFKYITIPQLAPALLVAVALYTIWTMNTFIPYVLVKGGLGNRAVTLPIYIYNLFFKIYDFGRGAAAATLLFLMNLLLAIIYLRSLRIEW